MSQKVELKEVERRVFQSAFADGLVELMLSSVVLMFVVAPFLSPYLGDFWSSALFVPVWVVVFGLLWLVRRQVVRPRVGVVQFGAWRRTRLLRFSIGMLVACTVALVLGILSALSFGSVPGWMHTARFSLVILIGFGLAAFFLDFTGLYLYGVLIALAPLAGEGLYTWFHVPHHGYPITFGSTALFLIIVGLVKMVRLVHRYPLPDGPACRETATHG